MTTNSANKSQNIDVSKGGFIFRMISFHHLMPDSVRYSPFSSLSSWITEQISEGVTSCQSFHCFSIIPRTKQLSSITYSSLILFTITHEKLTLVSSAMTLMHTFFQSISKVNNLSQRAMNWFSVKGVWIILTLLFATQQSKWILPSYCELHLKFVSQNTISTI